MESTPGMTPTPESESPIFGQNQRKRSPKRSLSAKKIKCHNFDSYINGKNPMWLRHPVTKIFSISHSINSEPTVVIVNQSIGRTFPVVTIG